MELLRRKLIREVVAAEMEIYSGPYANKRLEDGRQILMGKGQWPEQEFQTRLSSTAIKISKFRGLSASTIRSLKRAPQEERAAHVTLGLFLETCRDKYPNAAGGSEKHLDGLLIFSRFSTQTLAAYSGFQSDKNKLHHSATENSQEKWLRIAEQHPGDNQQAGQ